MPSNRVTRSRNLSNLHIIPTSASERAALAKNKPPPVPPPPPPVPPMPSANIILVPPATPNTANFVDTSKKFKKVVAGNFNKVPVGPFSKIPAGNFVVARKFNEGLAGNFNKVVVDNFNKGVRRRNRKRKRGKKNFRNQNPTVMDTSDDFHWANPNQNSEESKEVTDEPQKEETEKVEVVPPTTEEDFEEVEVASSDGDGKKIPVGFRKVKLHYLNYKKKSFFKPKFYDFSAQRTVINCLNVENDVDVEVDVDVVSEAEYDEYEADALDPLDKFDNIIEIEDDEMTDEAEEEAVPDEMTDEAEEEAVPDEMTDEAEEEAVPDEMEEESTDVVTEESMDSTHDVSNEVNKESTAEIGDKIEESVDAVIKESDEKSCVNKEPDEKSCVKEVNEEADGKSCVNKETNENLDDEIMIIEEDIEISHESDEVSIPKSWISPACVKGNKALIQGKSLIQDTLDAWGSHLIGLEYLVEVCHKFKSKVLNYYCVLCDKELFKNSENVEELSEAYVINHVCDRSHTIKYLEKHFPSWKLKLNENSSNYDFVFIQKLCEKINEKLGYHLMHTTYHDHYAKKKFQIKKTIQNASHLREAEFELIVEKSTFEEVVVSALSENIDKVVKNIIKKIVPENEVKKVARKKEVKKVTLEKEVEKETPEKEVKKETPVKEVKKATPVKEIKKATPVKEVKKATPVKEVKKATPEKEAKKATPENENKVIPKNEITVTDVKKCDKDNKSNSEDKLVDSDVNKPADSKSRPKHKGNNPVAAFLRLRFAADTKLPSKKSKNKAKSDKEIVKPGEESGEGEKSKSELSVENSVSKAAVENTQPKDKKAIEEVKLEVKTSKDNAELKTEQLQKKEVGDEAQKLESFPDNSAVTESLEVTFNAADGDNTKVSKNKEKVLLKPTLHSKHCRKRILDNGITRLRLAAAKRTPKGKLVKEVLDKSKLVTETVSNDAPKKIITKKIKPEVKKIGTVFTHKKNPIYKVISVQQPSLNTKAPVNVKAPVNTKIPINIKAPVSIKAPVISHTHQKSVHKKDIENVCKEEINVVANDSSHWLPMKASSPVLTSDISLFLKKIAGGPTQNPVRKRRVSRSPVRKITSPIRVVTKGYSRRHSKSPRRNKDSKSPIRRRSRSPYRKSSRSPVRRRSRSRSLRRHSRSPRRRSRSPRRRSRSPLRHSRSPYRRHSRSPRRRSRSLDRRYSRSSSRRLSRSPLRRLTRSPVKQRSRSPQRRYSRSPIKRRSRSPIKKRSRSPIKRRSRSPIKRRSRSPYPKLFSGSSLPYRNLRQLDPHPIDHPSSSREYFNPDDRYHRNALNYPKHMDLRESQIARSRDDPKMRSSKASKPDRYKSQTMPSVSTHGINDLDPVSDEDESIYFSDKHLRSDDIMSPSSKLLLSKLMQKNPVPDNSGDPAFNNLLQFMESHKSELEEFIALKSSPKLEKTNAPKIDPNFQQQTLLLQQYLLASLAGRIQEAGPSVPNLQYAPSQPPFLQDASLRFGHPSVNLPNQVMHQIPPQSAPMQPRFFPPNVNVPPPNVPPPNVQPPNVVQPPSVPPPQLFQPSTQPIQDFSSKPKPASEVMFKDLKATVNKLFGANESVMKQGIKPQMAGFVSNQLPNPEITLNHPNNPKFNQQHSQKNVYQSPVKNTNFSGVSDISIMREQMSSHNKDNRGQFFSGGSNDRSQIPSVPPPDAKVTFCDSPRNSAKGNLFPVVNPSSSASAMRSGVNDVKVSLAQRLASVLVKIGMVDVPAPLLQEMLMKIGAFSSSPRQDISENEILSILKRLGYLS